VTPLEAALAEVVSVFEAEGIPYMLIGGLAVAAWNVPRTTLDVDVTVWVDPARLAATVETLCARFGSLSARPLEFVRETRVLPALAAGVRVDIIFGQLAVEREFLNRAVVRAIGPVEARVISLEDLIFAKLLSERPKDYEDARLLIRYHRRTLDREYLAPRVAEMAEALGRPDMLAALDG
jgi:hypothetical protein